MGESDVVLYGKCRAFGHCTCGGKLGCDQEKLASRSKFNARATADVRQLFGICRVRGECDPADCGLCEGVRALDSNPETKIAIKAAAKQRWIAKHKPMAASKK